MDTVCTCSATFQHFTESITSVIISLQDLCDKGSSLIVCNKFSAKIIDLLLGIMALKYFLKYEENILEAIQVLIEVILILSITY